MRTNKSQNVYSALNVVYSQCAGEKAESGHLSDMGQCKLVCVQYSNNELLKPEVQLSAGSSYKVQPVVWYSREAVGPVHFLWRKAINYDT